MCIALNRRIPAIKMNGGGDLCQPTLDNKLLNKWYTYQDSNMEL